MTTTGGNKLSVSLPPLPVSNSSIDAGSNHRLPPIHNLPPPPQNLPSLPFLTNTGIEPPLPSPPVPSEGPPQAPCLSPRVAPHPPVDKYRRLLNPLFGPYVEATIMDHALKHPSNVDCNIAGTNMNAVDFVVSHLFDGNISFSEAEGLLNWLVKVGVRFNFHDESGDTALHRLMKTEKMSSEDMVYLAAFLLKRGGDANARNKNGDTPLMLATGTDDAMVDLLLVHGANLNVKNKLKEAPMSKLIQQLCDNPAGDELDVIINMAEKFISYGASPHDLLYTLHTCRGNRASEKFSKFLIQHGANVNQRDLFGNDQTPLIVAASEGYDGFCQLLCDSGSSVNDKDVFGATALTKACRLRYGKCVSVLLHAGADPNILVWNDVLDLMNSPIQDVVMIGFLDILTILLSSSSVNINIISANGNTPLDDAMASGHQYSADGVRMVRCLLRAGAVTTFESLLHGIMGRIKTANDTKNSSISQFLSNVCELYIEERPKEVLQVVEGMTPLALACRLNLLSIAMCIINGGGGYEPLLLHLLIYELTLPSCTTPGEASQHRCHFVNHCIIAMGHANHDNINSVVTLSIENGPSFHGTALELAISLHLIDTLGTLIDCGGDVQNNSPLEKCLIQMCSISGNTALLSVFESICLLLLRKGADPNSPLVSSVSHINTITGRPPSSLLDLCLHCGLWSVFELMIFSNVEVEHDNIFYWLCVEYGRYTELSPRTEFISNALTLINTYIGSMNHPHPSTVLNDDAVMGVYNIALLSSSSMLFSLLVSLKCDPNVDQPLLRALTELVDMGRVRLHEIQSMADLTPSVNNFTARALSIRRASFLRQSILSLVENGSDVNISTVNILEMAVDADIFFIDHFHDTKSLVRVFLECGVDPNANNLLLNIQKKYSSLRQKRFIQYVDDQTTHLSMYSSSPLITTVTSIYFNNDASQALSTPDFMMSSPGETTLLSPMVKALMFGVEKRVNSKKSSPSLSNPPSPLISALLGGARQRAMSRDTPPTSPRCISLDMGVTVSPNNDKINTKSQLVDRIITTCEEFIGNNAPMKSIGAVPAPAWLSVAPNGMSSLAAYYWSMLTTLIEYHANVQCDKNNSETLMYPLYEATLSRDYSLVALLVQAGAVADSTTGTTPIDSPLHLVLRDLVTLTNVFDMLLLSDIGIVLLHCAGANVNSLNYDSQSCLQLSINKNCQLIFYSLFKVSYQLNINLNSPLTSLLSEALMLYDPTRGLLHNVKQATNFLKYINYFINNFADFTCNNSGIVSVIDFGIKIACPAIVRVELTRLKKKGIGSSILTQSIIDTVQLLLTVPSDGWARPSLFEILSLLIDSGGDVNGKCMRTNQSALDIAQSGGAIDIMTALVAYGATFSPGQLIDILNNLVIRFKTSKNLEAEISSSIRRNIESFAVSLITAGADVNLGVSLKPGGIPSKPLDLSLECESILLTTTLLQHGARLKNKGFSYVEVLIEKLIEVTTEAQFLRICALIELLIKNGDSANVLHRSILSSAREDYRNRIIFLLLKLGADCNRRIEKLGPVDEEHGLALGDTPILIALKIQSTSLVKMIIDAGGDLNISNTDKLLPLHICFNNGNTKLARILVESGADVTCVLNLLIEALRKGFDEFVLLLLAGGADPDVVIDDKMNPSCLHLAVRCGKENLAKEFIKRGGNVNAINDAGESILHIACQSGLFSLVEQLLSQGAQTDTICNYPKRSSPLHDAVVNNNETIALLLLKNRANPSIKACFNYTPLHSYFYYKMNNANIVRALLMYNTDLVAIDINGNSPLHVAAICCCDEDIWTLLCQKIKYEDLCNIYNNNGLSVLHCLIINSQSRRLLDIVLLTFSESLSLMIDHLLLVLSIGTLSDNTLFRYFIGECWKGLQTSTSFYVWGNWSHYAWWAVYYGNSQALNYAIELGANMNWIDYYGRSILHWIIIWGHFSAEEMLSLMLCDCAAYINYKDKWGRSPLSLAKEYNREKIVTLLIGAGAVDESSSCTMILFTDNDFKPLIATLGFHEIIKSLCFRNVDWLRPQQTLLHSEKKRAVLVAAMSPNVGDVIIFPEGDLFLIAALSASLTKDDWENMFRVKDVERGYYEVSIPGIPTVIVDDLLPCVNGMPCFYASKVVNEFWPALLFKALAKHYGSYKNATILYRDSKLNNTVNDDTIDHDLKICSDVMSSLQSVMDIKNAENSDTTQWMSLCASEFSSTSIDMSYTSRAPSVRRSVYECSEWLYSVSPLYRTTLCQPTQLSITLGKLADPSTTSDDCERLLNPSSKHDYCLVLLQSNSSGFEVQHLQWASLNTVSLGLRITSPTDIYFMVMKSGMTVPSTENDMITNVINDQDFSLNIKADVALDIQRST